MPDLSIQIAGIDFDNPLIIGASSLTNDFDKIRALVQAGVGGITTKLISHIVPDHHVYQAKAVLTREGVNVIGDLRVSLDRGAKLVRKIKTDLPKKVPVIANIAGKSSDLDSWLKIALALKEAGADIIELDIAPGGLMNPDLASRTIAELKNQVGLPIGMKLGVDEFDYIAVAKAGKNSGAAMISGPNALPGIAAPDIHGFKLTYPGVVKQGLRGAYSGPAMNPVGLNFTLICAKVIQLPVISGGGVMTWLHAVERIALGASGISMVSAVYLKGLGAIMECLDGLKSYLTDNSIESVDDLRGIALKNYTNVDASEAEIAEAQSIDLENSWPDRLQNYWWSS